MFKDMTDAQLDEAITDLRIAINNAFGTKSARNMNWMLRQLDIAIAIRRRRCQAWSHPTHPHCVEGQPCRSSWAAPVALSGDEA